MSFVKCVSCNRLYNLDMMNPFCPSCKYNNGTKTMDLKSYQVNRRFELSNILRDNLKELGIDRYTFACLMSRTEIEVSKWLNGNLNMKMDLYSEIEFRLKTLKDEVQK